MVLVHPVDSPNRASGTVLQEWAVHKPLEKASEYKREEITEYWDNWYI
jgi:hypothetical protein